jgi:predicted RNase H-like HicB family nuclease
MKNIINVHVHKGEEYYIAESIDLPFVTQALSLDELMANIKEAVELTLDGEDLKDFNLSPNAQVLVNFELLALEYA